MVLTGSVRVAVAAESGAQVHPIVEIAKVDPANTSANMQSDRVQSTSSFNFADDLE